MGCSEKKSKKCADNSLVTRDSSQMLENVGTPGSNIKTPKSHFAKRLIQSSALAKECHLDGKPHCETADDTKFVCTSLIAENLVYNVDLTTKSKLQIKRYFETVCIVPDDTLKLFAGCV